jgi:hypothetical protein
MGKVKAGGGFGTVASARPPANKRHHVSIFPNRRDGCDVAALVELTSSSGMAGVAKVRTNPIDMEPEDSH